MADGSCSGLSRAAGEPLAGTASRADAYLLLEVDGAWHRDVLDGASLPAAAVATVRAWLDATPRSKALFVRRPDRRRRERLVFVVDAAGAAPRVRRIRLTGHEELPEVDLERDAEPVDVRLTLVCGHGRRDRCCARLGRPLFDALAGELEPESLWLSSHQGGHRFAPNLLWLPEGLSFGRIAPKRAPELVRELAAGRVPLDVLRGRTTVSPEAQAAEIAVRQRLGLTGTGDVQIVAVEDGVVRMATADGVVEVAVERREGPALPASCGAEPEPGVRYVVTATAS